MTFPALLQWRNWWKYTLVNFLAKTAPESCVGLPKRSKFDWPSVNHLTSNSLSALSDYSQLSPPVLPDPPVLLLLRLGIEFWTRTVCSANWVALTYICIVAPTSKLIFLSDDKHLDTGHTLGLPQIQLDTFKALFQCFSPLHPKKLLMVWCLMMFLLFFAPWPFVMGP